MARSIINPRRLDQPDWSAPELSYLQLIKARAAWPLHRSLPGYEPTPLRSLPGLAAELGLGAVLVKDEGPRFGIDAFKGLGASFAMFTVMRQRWQESTGQELTPSMFRDPQVKATLGDLVFCAATDGNHGRAVAWTARMLGQRAVIYMPDDTVPSRIASIEGEGAEARLIAGTFDHCVQACARDAEANGWQVIADTAYPGYMEIPGYIMTGYSTLFAEIAEQSDLAFDAVLLPAGVGGLAGAGSAFFVQEMGADRPRMICVEPEESACFLESMAAGGNEPIAAAGNQQSLMAGLNCGLPSLLAWPVIRDATDLFLAVADTYAVKAMQAYHRHGVESGESGAAALAGLLALMDAPELQDARDHLGLGNESRILVVNTEAATDPENHRRVVAAAQEDPS